MTREEFVQRMVIEQLGSLLSTDDPGYITPEKLIAKANEFADALYGPAKQVENDEMRILRGWIADLYGRLQKFRGAVDREVVGVPRHAYEIADDALNAYKDIYDKCQKVLREEATNAR